MPEPADLSATFVCSSCGGALPRPGVRCWRCARSRWFAQVLQRQSLVLAAIAVLAAGMFVLTHYVARAYEAEQRQLANLWFERGQKELNAGQVENAIVSLRSALAYSRENFQYRLRLAQALVSDEQFRQAQAYLLALWEQQPGNGTVNLELARIAAREGQYEQALRFYHGAIFGVWDDRTEERRREVRLELVQYLLRVDAVEQAQAELIALATELPRDAALHGQVGDLFRQAREYPRSLEQYRAALAIAPRDQDALRGAGEAAFELEQYVDAQRYLQRAVAQDAGDTRAADLLRLATLVRQMDPFVPRLSAQERARRVLAAYNQAQQRLAECANQRGETLEQSPAAPAETPSPPTELQAEFARLNELRPQMRTVTITRNPDLADTAMDAVGRVQQLTAELCGAPGGRDQALLLIMLRREQAEQ